jgi:hypothetical protein
MVLIQISPIIKVHLVEPQRIGIETSSESQIALWVIVRQALALEGITLESVDIFVDARTALFRLSNDVLRL